MEYNLLLASNSPRRKELLAGLNLPFRVWVKQGIDESYPDNLAYSEVPKYLAAKKAQAYREELQSSDLLITADTVVIVGTTILGKPVDAALAKSMLRMLSGKTHQVVTGVALTTLDKQYLFSVKTDVAFKELTDAEIAYYVEKFKPFDKAGAYGIQEWIGYIGVVSLQGSYYNVMGLPVQRIYEELTRHFDFTLLAM